MLIGFLIFSFFPPLPPFFSEFDHKGRGGMADMEQNLSLADALTEPPPQIEEEVKRDFMATLEAEKFDDVIGEKVGKTDYVPLLDDDDDPKAGNQEAKARPRVENVPRERECPDTGGSMVGRDKGGSTEHEVGLRHMITILMPTFPRLSNAVVPRALPHFMLALLRELGGR